VTQRRRHRHEEEHHEERVLRRIQRIEDELVLAEIEHRPKTWWSLSFSAEDGSHLGTCLVRGFAPWALEVGDDDTIAQGVAVLSAAREAYRLGINPGGALSGLPFPEDENPMEGWRERLLDAGQVADYRRELEARAAEEGT
jgi:hypothetical protein